MTNVPESIGLTRAGQAAGIPAVISLPVETDGRLPTGQSLKGAIEAVDGATGDGPAYYMINCAHPTHFEDALTQGESWLERIRGLRANACHTHRPPPCSMACRAPISLYIGPRPKFSPKRAVL